MKKSYRLVFFGNERIATGLQSTDAPTLRALLAEGYDIAAVVAHYTPGRSRTARKLEIAEVAQKHGIPLLNPKKPKDIKDELKAVKADAGILVAYGRIIGQDIINLFPRGIINIHPSLLPKYRGPTPIEQCLLDGSTVTGVSIMQLSAEMDAGPVYVQAQYRFERHETKEELAGHLLNLGKDLLIDALPSILDGSLVPEPQDDARATYSPLITKDDGVINPSMQTAREIERTVRAYCGYPKTRISINGHRIVITGADVVPMAEPGKLDIECHGDSVLRITELTAPSGRKMTGEDFVRGYMKSKE